MFLGVVLVGMALALFLYNRWDADRADQASGEVLARLESVEDAAKEQEEGKEKAQEENDFVDPDTPMKTAEIDGYEYIGTLSIPALGLELPIMNEWSYAGLKIAPGRYSGSLYSDDLVIAGHNYRKHFSPIKWLETGAEVDFKDLDEHVWRYEVSSVETLKPTDIEKMVMNDGTEKWDLTLFTCTQSGKMRCAVRCVRIDKK